MKRFLSLLITLILLLSLSACGDSFEQIDIADVKAITLRSNDGAGHLSTYTLTKGETERFIELYNASTYVGKEANEVYPPRVSATIKFTNDRTISVNECLSNLADFEVKNHYINNQELLDFIKGCIQI